MRGRHKTRTLGFRSLLNIFADMFHCARLYTWDVFFWQNLGQDVCVPATMLVVVSCVLSTSFPELRAMSN